MLARSPPFPLVVGYFKKGREVTAEDEEGLILALKQRGRVRHVRFGTSAASTMQKLIVAMDEEYPILESLYITLPLKDKSSILTFPKTLQAPHLRYTDLRGFALPIGSRLLTTAVGLVTLNLVMLHPSTYFHPNTLLQWISLMLHLEMLKLYFQTSIPNRNIERQLIHVPIIAPITHPNLRHFHFRGVSAYLEALVHGIITPRLEKLQIEFFNQLVFSVPSLLQFIGATENFRFSNAILNFSNQKVHAGVYPHGETLCPLSIVVDCCPLDWQVSSMT